MEQKFSGYGESDKSLKHELKGGQFKDPVYHLCLTDAVVVSCSLAQEVAGSNNFNDKKF